MRPLFRRSLVVQQLENRSVPATSLLGFDTASGDWKVAVPDQGHLDVATVAHWDPHQLQGFVHGDFDGDGRTDVAGWNRLGYWLVARGTPAGSLDTEKWPARIAAGWDWRTYLVGDFDNDRRDDIAQFAADGSWWVARSTGAGFETTRWDRPGEWRPGSTWKDWKVGDFDGDGRSDLAGLTDRGGWQVGLSTGSGFQPRTWLPDRSWAAGQVRAVVVGDFNSDGKADLAGLFADRRARVAVSTGDDFNSGVWAELPFVPNSVRGRAFAGDLTGDGRTDLAAVDRSGVTWLLASDGGAFKCTPAGILPQSVGQPRHINVGDFNGDSRADVAVLTDSGNWVVGTSDGTHLAYAQWGGFGPGNWIATFADQSRQDDLFVNRHSALGRNSLLYFVSPQDVARLRRDPAYFGVIFGTYQFRLRERLGAQFWEGNDRAVAFSLATMVAYMSASYRGANDPEGWFPRSSSFALPDLLATRKLVCNEYGYLAAQLYRVVYPAAADPGTTVTLVGFGSGPFGNHGQLVFSSGGVHLLGDPTLGLVAETSWADLRTGRPVFSSGVRQLVRRVESTAYMEQAMASFRSRVYGAIVGGLYPRAWLIYAIPM
jgi:hypothetical protein